MIEIISLLQELEGLDEKASANVLIMRQQKQLQDAKKVRSWQHAAAGLRNHLFAWRSDENCTCGQNNSQTKELYQKALEEDASVFDYDGVYDDMKKNDKAWLSQHFSYLVDSSSPCEDSKFTRCTPLQSWVLPLPLRIPEICGGG